MDLPQQTLATDGTIWFSPDFLSNLDLEAKNQAGFRVKPFADGELRSFEKKHLLVPKRLANQKAVVRASIKREEEKRETVLSERVLELRNWFDIEDGAKVEVTTLADLRKRLCARGLSAACEALVQQIYNKIRGESEMDEELLGE